jgi:hypothetical protein
VLAHTPSRRRTRRKTHTTPHHLQTNSTKHKALEANKERKKKKKEKKMKTILTLTLAVTLLAASANAECANGCSGHGVCGANDMCTCYRNWQGNDCAHRTCPYAFAHTTTPQGDLNLDGDRLDNSGKILSEQGTIKINTKTITFANSGVVENTEVKVGDGLKICDETFVITAVSGCTSGLCTSVTVDHVATKTCTSYDVYLHLVTQRRPSGDWEIWPGDFSGSGNQHTHFDSNNNDVLDTTKINHATDEGHFYMECSNAGLCDRSTGVCECFDGWTGAACTRQACPNDCSGHGTCQSVDELRTQAPTKVWNKNTQKVVTCTVAARADTVKCDANLEGANSALENNLAAGDYIQLKPFPPMRVTSVLAMEITLDNAVSDVVAYGTELYQVHKYGLWDAQKNRACVCDPRWTGDDCSQKKCPRGDDPLTVKSYDEQKNYILVDNNDAAPESSWYEQRAEKQTLVIDSDAQAAIGHFYLTFTDFYGDEFKSLPIPTEVQLSVTASTSTEYNASILTFDGNSAGLPATELTRGDTIRIGADYKRVVAILYKNTNYDASGSGVDYGVTKGLFIEKVMLDSAPKHGSISTGHHYPGTRVYRTDVSKEIREALLNIPNGRIEGVSVEKIDRAGRSIGTSDVTGNDGTIGFSADSEAKVGDIVRVKDEITRVESIASDDLTVVTVFAKPGASSNTATIYKQNGAKYRINFESGCEKDSDCNSNGIDSTASDAGAICTLGGTCLCSDKTSTKAYNGKGCTVDGKGNHQRSYIRANSGDIESMKCDKSRLFSGAVADKGANVARTAPTKVVFEAALTDARAFSVAVGDLVYIDGQVRTVTMVEGSATQATSLTVDEPFKSYGWSDDNFLVPPGSWVYVLDRDGGAGISCTSTDLPPLTSSSVTAKQSMQVYAEKVATGASVQDRGDSIAKRKIELASSGRVFDDDEIYVGDRIRVFDTARKSWETRTVDSIDYVAVTSDNQDNEGMISAIYVDSPFKASTGVDLYVDNRGTTEAIECSRRGLCDQTTGVCACFNGYTGPACNRQDAMFSA